jgi:hypothetical protein
MNNSNSSSDDEITDCQQQSEEKKSEKKLLIFEGQQNKYQMKKLLEKKEKKKRVACQKWNIDVSNNTLFDFTKQLEIIRCLNNNHCVAFDNQSSVIVQEIERKINGYKQQDILKKVFETDKIINLQNIVEELVKCECKCYYCHDPMLILYEHVRENKQWSVDRVDNDIGHYVDNYVFACLDCNLKRRRITKDKFLFTKNLNIVRHEERK